MADIQRIDIERLTLSVHKWSGGEPTMLALHGLASNARWWDLVAARLSPRYRVIAPDLRGHGLSDKPDTGYDFSSVVSDLWALCNTMGIGNVVVVGHSWGASVALAFAAEHVDKTIAVVCVDGGAMDLATYFGGSWEAAEVAMRPPQLSGINDEMLRSWLANSPLAEGSDSETALAIMRGNFGSDGDHGLRPHLTLERHMQIAKHLYHLDSYAQMAKVKCPVLFIPAGDASDPSLPKKAGIERALNALGERGSVVWVDGVHDLPVQKPAPVAAAITEFLERIK